MGRVGSEAMEIAHTHFEMFDHEDERELAREGCVVQEGIFFFFFLKTGDNSSYDVQYKVN